MKDPNDEKWKILKEEADQVLFQQIEFTEEMKEKVRQKSRDTSSKKLKVRRWKPYMMMASAAAVFLIVIISTMITRETENRDSANEMNIFMGEDENSPLISEAPINDWTLASIEEVKQMFPQALIPTEIAELYSLERITASGAIQEETDRVVITYVHQNSSYLVIIEKSIYELEPLGFEDVEINGVNGKMRTEDSDEFSHTEVQWEIGNYQYRVIGSLTSEEALKVARSFK